MRVLLIEDDERLAESLRASLRAAGYAVDVSADGVEGLYLGEEFPIDLAIIDLGLPELPGLEVIRRLRSHGRDFPILVLTARSEWQSKVEGLEAGADDYLTKPFNTDEVKIVIGNIIDLPTGVEFEQTTATNAGNSVRFNRLGGYCNPADTASSCGAAVTPVCVGAEVELHWP